MITQYIGRLALLSSSHSLSVSRTNYSFFSGNTQILWHFHALMTLSKILYYFPTGNSIFFITSFNFVLTTSTRTLLISKRKMMSKPKNLPRSENYCLYIYENATNIPHHKKSHLNKYFFSCQANSKDLFHTVFTCLVSLSLSQIFHKIASQRNRVLKWWRHKNLTSKITGFVGILWKAWWKIPTCQKLASYCNLGMRY